MNKKIKTILPIGIFIGIAFSFSCANFSESLGGAKLKHVESGARLLSTEEPAAAPSSYQPSAQILGQELKKKLDDSNPEEIIKINILLRPPSIDRSSYAGFEGGFSIGVDNEVTNIEFGTSAVDLLEKMENAPDTAAQDALLAKAMNLQTARNKEAHLTFYSRRLAELNERLKILGVDFAGGIANDHHLYIGSLQGEFSRQDLAIMKTMSSDYIQSISLHREGVPLTSADVIYTNIRANFAHANHPISPSDGTGVRIFMGENSGNCPRPGKAELARNVSRRFGGPTIIRQDYSGSTPFMDDGTYHAAKVAEALLTTAPGAQIICSSKLNNNWNYHQAPIANYSWGYIPNYYDGTMMTINAIQLLESDFLVERLIRTDKFLIFNSAGNGPTAYSTECSSSVTMPRNPRNCIVNSPAKGHNVMTVGAFDINENPFSIFSNYGDPATGAVKPEIVGPGNAIDCRPNSHNVIECLASDERGTSISSPLAAGLAASYLSFVKRYINSSFDRQPAALKASMLAMSAKNIKGTKGNPNDYDEDGVGSIQWNPYGTLKWKNHTNVETYFEELDPNNSTPADGVWKPFTTEDIKAYANHNRIRIAISWLNDESYAMTRTDKLGIDIDLRVVGPNGTPYESITTTTSPKNSWKMVDFNLSDVVNSVDANQMYSLNVSLRLNRGECKPSNDCHPLDLGYRMAYIYENGNTAGTSTTDPSESIPLAQGSGASATDPYLIKNYAQLAKIGSSSTLSMDKHYVLANDIDASSSWSDGASGCTPYYDGQTDLNSDSCTGWEPLGSDTKPFTGSFDGKGYTISNLYIHKPAENYVGLFGYAGRSASISNVGLTNVKITGGGYVGGLTGKNEGTIQSSYAAGNVLGAAGGYGSLGGLAGENSGTIENSYATGNVNCSAGGYDYAGGLVGINNSGLIQNSYATGNVLGGDGDYNRVGGLAGRSSGTIRNSYAKGEVNGSAGNNDHVGGLVGRNIGWIENSYAAGSVLGGDGNYDRVGGLVGVNYNERGSYGGRIENSYAVGNTDGGNGVGDYVGGLAGYSDGYIQNSYYNNNEGNISGEYPNTFGTGRALYQLRKLIPTGWNKNNWDFGNTNQYPTLRSYILRDVSTETGCINANGTWNYGYCSITPQEQQGQGKILCGQPGAIDLPNPSRVPCTSELANASGDLDGDGELDGTDIDADGDGLIEITDAAMLENVRNSLDGSRYYAPNQNNQDSHGTTTGCGGLPGIDSCHGYELVNDITLTGTWEPIAGVLVSRLTNWTECNEAGASWESYPHYQCRTRFTGNFNGNGKTINGLTINTIDTRVGFFAILSGTVKNLNFRGGSVSSTNTNGGYNARNQIGVVAGRVESNGILDNVSSNALVKGSTNYYDRVGGLAGQNEGTIQNSYATGNVNGNSGSGNRVGGLAGENSGTIENSYAAGNVLGGTGYGALGGLAGSNYGGTIQDSYATGNVNGSAGDYDYTGGLVGTNNSGIIQNSYATGKANGGAGSNDTVGGDNDYVGGLVGGSSGAIRNSYAKGEANGSAGNNDRVGGLVGKSIGWIENSYAAGNADGGAGSGDYVGGLVGENYSSIYTYGGGTIQKTYATGNVDGGNGNNDYVGGLVGGSSGISPRIQSSYYNNTMGNIIGEYSNNLGTGKTLAELDGLTADQTEADFPGNGWSENNWDFGSTNQYPSVRSYILRDVSTQGLCEDPDVGGTWDYDYCDITPPAQSQGKVLCAQPGQGSSRVAQPITCPVVP